MGFSPTMDRRMEDSVRDELTDGEKAVWCAQPRPWALARAAIPMFLFGIPLFGFALFWECMALFMTRPKTPAASGPPDAFRWVFPLFGIPFLLIGLGMLLSPIWYRLRAPRTVYVLTDRRAIVMSGTILGTRVVKSYKAGDLGSMSRIERSDGSGDLVFATVPTLMQWKGSTGVRTKSEGFLGVEGVRELERQLKQTLGVA